MTTPAQITALIRELAAAFVEKPAALNVVAQPSRDGACYFAMKGALEDEPKLVGSCGCHVQALTLLVEQIGFANGHPYTFRLVTEGTPQQRRPQPPRDVLEHDPRPHVDLLARILDALGVIAKIECGPGTGPRNSLTFVFTIRAATGTDVTRLVGFIGDENATIIGALGTLFRAIAKKNGVRYNLDCVRA